MKNYIFVRNKTYRPSSYYRICQYLNYDNVEIIEYELDIFYKINKKNKISKRISDILLQLIPGYVRRIANIVKIISVIDPIPKRRIIVLSIAYLIFGVISLIKHD